MHTTCIFCRIIRAELPSTPIFQDDTMIIIQDRFPKAPIHWLAMPREHIENMSAVTTEQWPLISTVLQQTTYVAREKEISQFRLLTNNGASVGQSVFHLHFHLLAGAALTDF